MNKNLKEVLVKREYHGQIWFDIRVISNDTIEQICYSRQTGRNHQQVNGQNPPEEHSFR